MNELDLYFTLSIYVSQIWSDGGEESKKSKELLQKVNQTIKNKKNIRTTLPYISKTEVQSQMNQILTSFQHKNQKVTGSITKEERLRTVPINAKQTINDILIQLDDKVESATQTIQFNKELLIECQNTTRNILDNDTSYEVECTYSLSTIEQAMNKEIKTLEEVLQLINGTIKEIEKLLNNR